jgi:hypothetical protein
MNFANARSAWRLAAISAALFPVLFTVLFTGAAAGASVRAPAAARCYCPAGTGSGPAVAAPPGGYSAVVISRTIARSGGVIGAAGVPGGRVTLVIPAGAFPVPVQVTLTAPKLAAPGLAGYRVVAAVGIAVQQNGAAYRGAFGKPLTLVLRSSSVTPSSLVAAWNGRAFVTERGATAGRGAAAVRLRSGADPDLAVLSPVVTAAPAAIAGATTSMTGEPLAGEGILAAVLLVLGAGGLVMAVRSARRSDG